MITSASAYSKPTIYSIYTSFGMHVVGKGSWKDREVGKFSQPFPNTRRSIDGNIVGNAYIKTSSLLDYYEHQ